VPFTVVVFPRDLKNGGDIRQWQGRMIEIHGQVKEYDGRAEIILEEYRQLSGSTARIPPLPKNYDVEKKGRYSAGTFSHPKAGKKPSNREKALKEETNRQATNRYTRRLGLVCKCRADTLVRPTPRLGGHLTAELEECEQLRIHLILEGRAHVVRRPRIDFQRGSLDEL
jgi:hypothetical protein